ncbi:MAG: type IV pilus assembly protein PilM [Deltaproteobacteria bacterium]|jgi:type IV pilus assembly protein PilM
MAKGKLAVGLDIGSGSVKLCHLKPAKRGNYQLQSFGMVQLPPEAIVDGALMNSTAVVDAVQELFASQKIRHKEVATSVSGHSVIIKKINLPQMTPEELEESIQWEAEQYIPFDINDVNIDVQILNTESTQAGQMDVLLVAAKKDMVNDYTEVIASAGLTPVVVDIDAFAVQNQFEINYEVPRSETVVLVNIGAAVTNINVLANGVSTFTRDISIGGGQFTDAVQKALNVSYDEAEALKLGGGGPDSDAVVPQEVERVLQTESESIANEIQRSLDFYAATSADAHIARIFLSGGSSRIPALVKTIENRTGVPVEVLNPFRNIDISSGRFDPEYLQSVAPMAAVAMGLALRFPADK